MSFSCELLCRACMEPLSTNSMPLVNKKKKKKTSICINFEDLTGLKVKVNDQLPQQLCLGCVSELNKCFAFREKCTRTSSTLRAYLDLSEDEDASADDQYDIEKKAVSQAIARGESKEGSYEEIEVTQEMVDAAKASEMVLEMEEEISILNPTSSNLKIQAQDEDELVFIIQDVSGTSGSTRIVQSTSSPTVESEKKEENSKLTCFTCKMEFVRKKNFDNHVKRFHSGETEDIVPESKRLKLSLTRASSGTEQLKKNLVANPDAKKCKKCGALYLNEKSLKLHEARGNACVQESYSCDVCNKIFTDQKLFSEHTESHPQQQEPEPEFKEPGPADPSKKFQCNVCMRSFKMVSTLKDHMRVHTGDKPFKCSICGRCFSQNTNLKQHLRRHTQIKPFKCEHEGCTATFVSKGELDSHNRTHTGHHPYSCDLCDASFTTSSSLLKHKRIHSGEKPYACEFCPMRFTALGTLRNHTRTHTGEKPHSCSFCDRAFTQKSDMVAHERTHTGDRPYVCKICSSSFLQSGTLKNHMKIHKKAEVKSDDEDDEDEDKSS